MKNKILFTCFIFLCLHQATFGQFVNIPQPTRYYPLDNESANDVIDPKNSGSIYGRVQFTADRFSNPKGAMYILPHSGIVIPPLDELFRDLSNGFTFSFWTLLEDSITKNEGIRPWADTDNIYRYFSVNNKDEVPLFGFERIRDRAVINRHVFPNHYTKPENWKLWFWDPTNFTMQTGWYHIVMVCEHSRTRLFVFKPNGEIASNMHYFRFQNLTADDFLTEFGSVHNNYGIFLDDFKFFDKAFTRDEVMQLHGEDAAPQGMYYINTAQPGNRLIHSRHSYNTNSSLEILDFNEERQSVFKWVIEPAPGENQLNRCRIRMAYTQLYFGPANNSAAASTIVQIRPMTMNDNPLLWEWFIEPVPGEIGYYFIKLAQNPAMHLHTRYHSGNNSTLLELLPFDQAQAQSYKWKLNLINTNYELARSPFDNDKLKVIVSDINPFLQILPDNPNATRPTYGIVNNRWSVPFDNRMLWILAPAIDGSYMLQRSPFSTLNPEGNNVQKMDISTWVVHFDFNNRHASMWVLNRNDNPFGSRFRIQLAANPLVQLSTTGFSSRINTPVRGLRAVDPSNANVQAQRWMFFDISQDESQPPNEQIYHINPGVYRIQLAADTIQSITTDGNRFTPSTRLIISSTNRSVELSHYWFIDYERTPSGKPVKDGSYLIKLIGTDQYMHTVNHSLTRGARLEVFTLDMNNIGTYKFFIRPEGGGLYSMSIAGDRSQLAHTYWSRTTNGTPLEITNFEPENASTFKWRFQKVNLNNDIQDGVYMIQSNTNTMLNMTATVVPPNQLRPGDRLSLSFGSSPNQRTRWNIVKDEDGTYMIYANAPGQKLYVHPYMDRTASGTPLEVFHSNNTNVRYPFTYRWIAEDADSPLVFRFRLVGPNSQYIHILNNNAINGAPIEIQAFWPPSSNTFEWRLFRFNNRDEMNEE